jgi:hypothetical protein
MKYRCGTSLILLLFSVLFFTSCNLINPSEPQPSYLQVNHIMVTSNYTTQGTNSAKVKDVWAYVDGNYIGTFELPARFPVLLTGVHHVFLGAGIYINGISATREAYPMYKIYSADINFSAGQTSVIDTATVSYYSDLQYSWYEDFEGSGYSLDTLSSSAGNLVLDTIAADVFEGHACLHLPITSTDTVIECVTNNFYPLPKGQQSYLEMNYRCDQPFLAGLYATNLAGDNESYVVISLNASPTWNKIYIKLSPTVNAVQQISGGFKVYLGAALQAGSTQGNVYIDNMKLIYK